ncbi:unnamed protein product [Phytophthora lilii]|uniref:Unnamed protein product n=1 Tax=Phytophthora lilii TaxID=2077276 RepID=A0A9W6YJM6_9STRA|nr:unnamed protein product [Phytophthora lilii]
MRELRREGARVRVELEKVDDTAEAAVERAERCAQQAQAAQERALAAGQIKDEALKAAQAMQTRHTAELDKLGKRLSGLDKRLGTQQQSSINEEFLMTQLAELQEQYENELTKVREDHDAALDAKQKQLDELQRALRKLRDENKQKQRWENMERIMQTLREENNRLSQKLSQVVTRQDMQAMQEQLKMLHRDNIDEQGRTRADLNAFEDKLVDVDRKVADLDRKIDDVGERPMVPSQAHIPPAPTPLPPPPPPRDLVRQGELAEIRDVLRRVNRDFQAVGVDMASLEKRLDAKAVQRTEARLQELSNQLFDALNHDSRLHATEISRLKDAVFDMQGDYREFGKRMRQLEDDVAKATRAQPRSPRYREGGGGSDWHNGNSQAPALSAPPPPQPLPPPLAFRNRRERPSRYEPAPGFRENAAPILETAPQDRIRWAPRRRSRSRSPPRRPSWNNYGNGTSRNGSGTVPGHIDHRYYQRDNQRYNAQSSNDENFISTRSSVTELSDSPPSLAIPSSQNAGESRRNADEQSQVEQSSLPFRRSRQPRRTPEVIVIEGDDEDDDENVEAGAEGGEEGEEEEEEEEEEEGEELVPSPSRAPPDVVLDEEEASQEADVVMAPPSGSGNTGHLETTDLLEKDSDLQTGFLLYFCLGGAPDLDVQWTNCFTQLKNEECVEMPRALRFQRRYGFLQNFPVYLTQCILQAVILNGQNVPEGSNPDASRPTEALNASNIRTKFDDVVKGIHLSWAKALIEHLSKQASAMDELVSEKLELAVNPAGLSSSAGIDDIICQWSRQQESMMWMLARKLRHGSFLPAIKCRGDASPAVYLFALMFDLLAISSDCPNVGTFRLNAIGGKLLAHLWDHTLRNLPYMFFADWSWLDDQSSKQKLPALAFCHLLTSILLWNSAIDHNSLTNRNIYAAAVKHILPKIYVGGEPIRESVGATDSSSLQLGECESTPIELLDLDSKFADMLGLDGFFDVMNAIQNNMLTA